ncbi:hypothetical protein BC937DRAFT_93123 [Endogone sp. FLAS-F59071]|nr:hypothetical protein BC937DRAFT_93123 [Endogone sp. FLAS-F59071]|eukprot:RUS21279.1 hypothetical protein BC937DRAFT_93123 [Endogone sp. FLAS-F59071]
METDDVKENTDYDDFMIDDDEAEQLFAPINIESAPVNIESAPVNIESAPRPAFLTVLSSTDMIFAYPLSRMELDENDPVMLLRVFYQRFFPFKTYFQWLNYDTVPTKNFFNREFSFTLASEVYIRYNSFQDADELYKEIGRLQPVKIDIGAVYTTKVRSRSIVFRLTVNYMKRVAPTDMLPLSYLITLLQPKDRKTVPPQAFQPVEKELVFDIDMTDYDEVRTCCSGADICHMCWKFMTISIKIIDIALREDFGFVHLLWVYSGRRGVHCWVCDERARRLTNESRKAIVQYLEVVKGSMQQAQKVKLPNILPPSLNRSLEILKQYFEELVLENQRTLDVQENWNKLLQIVPDAAIRETLDHKWQKSSHSKTGSMKWAEFKNEIVVLGEGKAAVLAREIIFQYCYPRLDDKVSTQINHLLKSPFCVHPKTNRVCVPIDPARCDEFDPFKVPTLAQLNKEINEYNKNSGTTNEERQVAGKKKSWVVSVALEV